jgi:cytochrome c oxidase assembly protein subunit 15
MKAEGGKWSHRFALLTAGATLPLLFIGGLVTSKGAGLAVPDWPTTFGHNMFLFPWSGMIGDIFYEHSHRLFASGVGLLTILLALSLWLDERRPWLRWLGVAALALVVTQGILGGLRVVWLEQTLAIVHGCLAQAFFGLTVSLVLFTSTEWAEEPHAIELLDAARLQRLCVVTTVLIYLQGIFGAVLRFTGSGLWLHLLFAVAVAVHIAFVSGRILRWRQQERKFVLPALLLAVLVVAQIALGVGSYLAKFTALGAAFPGPATVILTTAHVVTGALLLGTSLVLTLRCYRFLTAPDPSLRQGLLAEQYSL